MMCTNIRYAHMSHIPVNSKCIEELNIGNWRELETDCLLYNWN